MATSRSWPATREKSELIKRVSATDPRQRMPQRGEALPARDVEVLRRWIAQGAAWQGHWAFIPPVRPAVPAVKNARWVRDAHRCVRAAAHRAVRHLAGARGGPRDVAAARHAGPHGPAADARASSTPSSADRDGHGATRRSVDRLLTSPRYGERMAFPWLEAARYADSNGYQSDGERHQWRWRDWVINAFNANMPLEPVQRSSSSRATCCPTPRSISGSPPGSTATTAANSEGGIIPEEYAAEYVVDRADTMATVFLGLTGGLRALPQPQVRSDPAEALLPVLRVLQQHPRERQGAPPGQLAAVDQGAHARAAARAAEARPGGRRRHRSASQRSTRRSRPTSARGSSAWPKDAAAHWGPSRGLVAHCTFDGSLNAEVSKGPNGKPSLLKEPAGGAQFGEGRLGGAVALDGKTFILGEDITGFSSHGFYDDRYSIATWVHAEAATGAIVTK